MFVERERERERDVVLVSTRKVARQKHWRKTGMRITNLGGNLCNPSDTINHITI